MGTNMGTIDRALRLAVAILLVYLALGAGVLSGAVFWVALAVAAIFAVTAAVSVCPLYRLVGLKTCKEC